VKLLHVTASAKGFHLAGKPHNVSHSPVDLLQQLNNAFANVSNLEFKSSLSSVLTSLYFMFLSVLVNYMTGTRTA
jgi:hypothetical protein